MDLVSTVLSLVALAWIIFREVAPKTGWKWDDRLVNYLDGVSEAIGVEPEDLIARGRARPKMGKKK